jgi:hypothetical protein
MTIGMLYVLKDNVNLWVNPFAGDEERIGRLDKGEHVVLVGRVKNTKEQVVNEWGPVHCDMVKVLTRLGVGYLNDDGALG